MSYSFHYEEHDAFKPIAFEDCILGVLYRVHERFKIKNNGYRGNIVVRTFYEHQNQKVKDNEGQLIHRGMYNLTMGANQPHPEDFTYIRLPPGSEVRLVAN